MKRKKKSSTKPTPAATVTRLMPGLLKETTFRQWLLGGIIAVFLLGILLINALPQGVDVEVGQVARKDLAAPITAVNTEETERLREEAARHIVLQANEDPAYYLQNPAIVLRVEENITGVLNLLRSGIAPEPVEEVGFESAPEAMSVSEIDRRLIRDWKMEIPKVTLEAIAALSFAEFDQFAQTASDLVLATMEERISEDGLRDARDAFEAEIELSALQGEPAHAATIIGRQLIQPNLVLDTEKVNIARQEAYDAVEPIRIMQGEIIVRKGDVVRPEHIQLLTDVGLIKTGRDYGVLAGMILTVIGIMAFIVFFLHQEHPKVLQSGTQVGLVGSVLIAVVAMGKLFSIINWAEAAYLNPSALLGLLLTLLIDARVASIATVALAVMLGLVFEMNWVVTVLALVGGLAAVLSVSKVSQRGDVMRAGFIVGGVNVFLMISLGLAGRNLELAIHSYLGLLSGVLASVIAIGVLPYLESLFKIVSPIRLLELSNPNHPLLRRLMLEAPGTYHHSILVGNLAEAAAESIGADGLLARVGSHYHDIGKLRRPYFFVENQVGKDNPHDKMAPSLSTLIITSHVKDGVELASEFKLPPVVTQFIAQHHGTDLVRFFYHRACEASGDDSVEERDFRYLGPKPQGKEVAIVSLADATEAAVRSISKPNPGKIEGLVRKIIKDRLNSGELDESDLTFQDMDRIANAFTKVIMGMFHARVEYPEQITKEEIEGKKARNGSSDKQ
ncbi:MAG TPA: HDIG domain-containing protein [Limnochordia bacterium]|nr:HDIG domain-containing protein [Limnochordia bacterium]